MSEFEDKKKYLETVKQQIRCRKAREIAVEELESHIDDQILSYQKYGCSPEEAEKRAVKKMGDPVDTGLCLDRIHRPRMNWFLFGFILCILFTGILIYYSLSEVMPESTYFFHRHVIGALGGIIVLLVIHFLDYTILAKKPMAIWWIFWAAVYLFCGRSVNGADSWVMVGMNRVTLYAFYSVSTPLYAGILYSQRGNGWGGICKSIFCWAVPAAAILPSDIHAFLLFSAACFFMGMFAVKKDWFHVNRKELAVVVAIIFAIFVCLFFMGQGMYRIARLQAMINPFSDVAGDGYLGSMVKTVLHGAKPFGSVAVTFLNMELTGETLGNLLPAMQYDFILTYVIARFGYVAGAALTVIVLLLIGNIIRSSVRQKNAFGSMVSLGAGLSLLIQAALYILPNIGFSGIAPRSLPFVSVGMSMTLCNMVLAGLVLSVQRNETVIKEECYKECTAPGENRLLTWDKEKKQITIHFGTAEKQK